MLSQLDIEKELGKGINIVPFNKNNIKENSINLSTSELAWTLSDGTIYYNDKKEFSTKKDIENIKNSIIFNKGDKATVGDKIVLLPFSTTLIETKEVLGIANNIGGTYHSKVGIVSLGTGHIGTMLGPNFTGHSLIALHNISNEILTLEIGETFVSVVFHKLETPILTSNATTNGHLDMLHSFGAKPSNSDIKTLNQDWKKKFSQIKENMNNDRNFIEYTEIIKHRKQEKFKKLFSFKNILVSILLIIFIILGGLLSTYIDNSLTNPFLFTSYCTIVLSTVFSLIPPVLISYFKEHSR